MGRTGLQGNHQHHQIGEIAGQVIPKERVVRDIQESNHGSNAALPERLSLTASSSARRVPVRSTFCRRSLTSSLISVLTRSSFSSFARKSAFSSAVKYACNP